MSTTWDQDASGPDYWDWFGLHFEEEQRSFSIEGTYDPSYGGDEVQANATCRECFTLVASDNLGNLNGHRAFHDRLNGVN